MFDTVLPAITPERPEHSEDVDALIDAAFGPGRYAKAAERLREGNEPILDLSTVALDEGRIVGCSRIWPIHIGGKPALLLGPFAVTPEWRSKGLGGALVEQCCELARKAGHDLVLLVGDAPYFEKCGFKPVPPKSVRLPGPVNMGRVLVRELKPGAAEGLQGDVTVG